MFQGGEIATRWDYVLCLRTCCASFSTKASASFCISRPLAVSACPQRMHEIERAMFVLSYCTVAILYCNAMEVLSSEPLQTARKKGVLAHERAKTAKFEMMRLCSLRTGGANCEVPSVNRLESIYHGGSLCLLETLLPTLEHLLLNLSTERFEKELIASPSLTTPSISMEVTQVADGKWHILLHVFT